MEKKFLDDNLCHPATFLKTFTEPLNISNCHFILLLNVSDLNISNLNNIFIMPLPFLVKFCGCQSHVKVFWVLMRKYESIMENITTVSLKIVTRIPYVILKLSELLLKDLTIYFFNFHYSKIIKVVYVIVIYSTCKLVLKFSHSRHKLTSFITIKNVVPKAMMNNIQRSKT